MIDYKAICDKKHLKGIDTLSGEATILKMGLTKRREFAPLASKFFPFRDLLKSQL